MPNEAEGAAEPIGEPVAHRLRLLDHLTIGFPERCDRGWRTSFVDRLEFVSITVEFEMHA